MADGEAWRPLADRMAISDCLARLARGEDRRAADLIRTSFWPDATVDYGIFAGDFDAYLGWVVPGSDAITATQHMLGQSLMQIDGDVAKVETHVSAYHRIDAGEARGICAWRTLSRRDGATDGCLADRETDHGL